jgi:hypothetical protein
MMPGRNHGKGVTVQASEKICQKSPLPPFAKGGWGGISAMDYPIDMTRQNFDILQVNSPENLVPCIRRDDRLIADTKK